MKYLLGQGQCAFMRCLKVINVSLVSLLLNQTDERESPQEA